MMISDDKLQRPKLSWLRFSSHKVMLLAIIEQKADFLFDLTGNCVAPTPQQCVRIQEPGAGPAQGPAPTLGVRAPQPAGREATSPGRLRREPSFPPVSGGQGRGDVWGPRPLSPHQPAPPLFSPVPGRRP